MVELHHMVFQEYIIIHSWKGDLLSESLGPSGFAWWSSKSHTIAGQLNIVHKLLYKLEMCHFSLTRS